MKRTYFIFPLPFNFLLSIVVLLAVTEAQTAFAQSCTHYASPTGMGSGLSQGSPFQIANFWSAAGPGKTLCLLNGTYRGTSSMINPPDQLSGVLGNPITIRAMNDGAVSFDGQGQWAPVGLNVSNNYFLLSGFNASNGVCQVVSMRGRGHVLQRVVAWDANFSTSALCHPVIADQCTDCLIEDIAAFSRGWRAVLVYNSLRTTVRRLWSQWNEANLPPPNEDPPGKALETSYRSHFTTVENAFLTRNITAGPGNAGDAEILGVGCVSCGDSIDVNNQFDGTSHVSVYGTMVYIRNSDLNHLTNTNRGIIWDTNWASNGSTKLQDVVSWVDTSHTSSRPLRLNAATGIDNSLTRVTSISKIPSRIGATDLFTSASTNIAGWTIKNHNYFTSIAAGGSALDIWDGPGQANLCKRYINGALTTNPLWPWPMNQRIKDAMAQAGRTPVDVTATIESMFGKIPVECRSDGGVSPLALPGDLNRDGTVNSLDWSMMNSRWGTTDAAADLNEDGMVNSLDYAILNANWGKTL